MNTVDQGRGELFSNPDPDKLRSHFKSKNRKMVNKVMNLNDAASKFVHDEEYIATGGFGTNRVPIAACHEIVRQGKKNMGFAGHTATHDMEILSAGEVYDRLDVAYVVGLEARGLSTCSRKYVQSGKVKVTEWTNYGLTVRLKAAAMGVPFLPARNLMGTDTYKYSGAKTAKCPYTGKTFNKASDMDIDHIVPLSWAHAHGAVDWPRKLKRRFANDPDNLLAVEDNTNKEKGDKGPNEWMPPNKAFHEEYMRKWRTIIARYNLQSE